MAAGWPRCPWFHSGCVMPPRSWQKVTLTPFCVPVPAAGELSEAQETWPCLRQGLGFSFRTIFPVFPRFSLSPEHLVLHATNVSVKQGIKPFFKTTLASSSIPCLCPEMTRACLLLAQPFGLTRSPAEHWPCTQRVKRKRGDAGCWYVGTSCLISALPCPARSTAVAQEPVAQRSSLLHPRRGTRLKGAGDIGLLRP